MRRSRSSSVQTLVQVVDTRDLFVVSRYYKSSEVVVIVECPDIGKVKNV